MCNSVVTLSSLYGVCLCRLCECTEAEAEIILQLKNELREKELKLTDIRLEALSSAHHLDQIREAMNRMQVRTHTHTHLRVHADSLQSSVTLYQFLVNSYTVFLCNVVIFRNLGNILMFVFFAEC